MAKRRMFSNTICRSDDFLDMPCSTRCLYFHLGMEADDDGFVNSPKSIVRLCGCSQDDLKVLISKGFIIPFPSGIIAITAWKQNNYIQKDRYTETEYLEEKSMLAEKDNKSYYLKNNPCIQDVYSLETQISIDKISIDKTSIEERKTSEEESVRGETKLFAMPDVYHPPDEREFERLRQQQIEKLKKRD